ncbi:MAG: TolC family protein [Planctomycetaceae bacterium]|nr:TolC family protein [Planctomycetaceae bacterium]
MRGLLLATVFGFIITGCQSATPPVRAGLARPVVGTGAIHALRPIVPEDIPPAPIPAIPLPKVWTTPEANKPWPLSLREAVLIALRNSDIIRTLQGDQVVASGVSNYDPSVLDASWRATGAIFDPTLRIGYIADKYNQPPSTFFGPGLAENTRRDDATLTAALIKPWATGGSTSIAYNPSTGYLFFPQGSSGLFNPNYSSNIEISGRQPLLRGAGIDVNRAPIRIAQLQTGQSVWTVKQATLSLVRSVEEAYWSLQAAHSALQAVDDILPFIDDVVHIQEERFEEERTIRAEVGKARAQQATFRQSRINARSEAVKQELLLRNLLGLAPDDGLTIVPTSPPSRVPLQLDSVALMQIAVNNRPDLMRQRLGIRIREMELLVAENGLKPQFDLQALYRTNGLSDNVGDSLSMTLQNQFTDWTAGATFSIPLGRRAARATLQAAELVLGRERMVLRQQLHATAHRLGDLLRQLEAIRNSYDQAEIRVRETEEWLKGARGRYEDPPPGADGQDWLLLALNDYLLALRTRADANTEIAQILARYNTLLATLEEAQGTLLASYEIVLEGDPILQARSSPLNIRSDLVEPLNWDLDAENHHQNSVRK